MPEESTLLPPSTPSPDERLARYLTHRNRYRIVPTPSVKPIAFDPPGDLRLSVYRVGGLTDQQVWEIGQVNVIASSSCRLHGRADIAVSDVKQADAQLEIDCDNTPVRHACIIGWPAGDENKSKRMLISEKLAARATLILRS